MEEDLKRRLQADILWAATKYGAFQRSNIYTDNTIKNADKEMFRMFMKDFLWREVYSKSFERGLSEGELITLIETLIERANGRFQDILSEGVLRFGNAQKFVNLYLKCMWVLGLSEKPPHFPVDRIIQEGNKNIKAWTKMNKSDYLEVISWAKEKMKKEKKFTSLAEWEADTYNRKTYSSRD